MLIKIRFRFGQSSQLSQGIFFFLLCVHSLGPEYCRKQLLVLDFEVKKWNILENCFFRKTAQFRQLSVHNLLQNSLVWGKRKLFCGEPGVMLSQAVSPMRRWAFRKTHIWETASDKQKMQQGLPSSILAELWSRNELAIIYYLTGNHSRLKNITSNPCKKLMIAHTAYAHTWVWRANENKHFLAVKLYSEHSIVIPERGRFELSVW